MNKKTSSPKPAKKNFSERCYEKLCTVPKGSVTTYAELARALGSKGYRAVGQAMHRNPNAPRVPCHRVVRSDGSLGGYAFGLKKKFEILTKEGVIIRDGKVQGFPEKIYRFRR